MVRGFVTIGYMTPASYFWMERYQTMFINRNYNRTEHDDFVLNILPYISSYGEAVEVCDEEGNVVGWKIQNRYE
jgi:hypothetical protein